MARKKPALQTNAASSRKILFAFLLLMFAVFSILSIGTAALPVFSCSMFNTTDSYYYVWIPKNVSDYFSGDAVNLHFVLPYGNTMDVYGLVREREIAPLRCGTPREPDYAVSMTWREALGLTGSQQPIRDFVKMWDNGKIIVVPGGIDHMEKLQAARKTLLNFDNEPVPENVQRQFDKYRANSS